MLRRCELLFDCRKRTQMGHPEAAAALLAAGAGVTLHAVNGAIAAGKVAQLLPLAFNTLKQQQPRCWGKHLTASSCAVACLASPLYLPLPLAGSHQLLESLLQRGHPEVPLFMRNAPYSQEDPIRLSYEG